MAVDGKKQVVYEPRKELNHHTACAQRETVTLVVPVEHDGFNRLKDGGDVRPFIARGLYANF